MTSLCPCGSTGISNSSSCSIDGSSSGPSPKCPWVFRAERGLLGAVGGLTGSVGGPRPWHCMNSSKMSPSKPMLEMRPRWLWLNLMSESQDSLRESSCWQCSCDQEEFCLLVLLTNDSGSSEKYTNMTFFTMPFKARLRIPGQRVEWLTR